VNVRILEIAQQELDEAVSYYSGQAAGLGEAFLVRRCRLRRFPYGVIYHADEMEILVVAVAHAHRRPDYWRDRISSR
jgi:hypothetical protein